MVSHFEVPSYAIFPFSLNYQRQFLYLSQSNNVILLQDPCRDGVKEAVKVCTDAGVKVLYYVFFIHSALFLSHAGIKCLDVRMHIHILE